MNGLINMATYAKLLQDSNGDVILPYTRDSLIFNDDNTTLQYRLNSGTVHNATLWNGMSIANQSSGGQLYYWGFNGGASTTYAIPISTIAGQTLTYLWGNANVHANFPSQTIWIDFSPYQLIMILFNRSASNDNMTPAVITYPGFGGCGVDTQSSLFRYFTTGGNYISFGDGSMSGGSTNNDWIIPARVYGLR